MDNIRIGYNFPETEVAISDEDVSLVWKIFRDTNPLDFVDVPTFISIIFLDHFSCGEIPKTPLQSNRAVYYPMFEHDEDGANVYVIIIAAGGKPVEHIVQMLFHELTHLLQSLKGTWKEVSKGENYLTNHLEQEARENEYTLTQKFIELKRSNDDRKGTTGSD